MKVLLSILCIILAFVFTADVSAQQKKAANFALKSAEGKTFELNKYHGKIVIVNFWATWCGPCRREIPDFIELYRKYKGQGLEIIGISVDEDGWESVTPYVKESGINYPIVLQDDKVVKNYGSFSGIPTTFIVDGNGTILFEQTGTMTKAQLESKIKPLLKKGA
jgi:thiol-disulfide isomerase/thioredoxin